jgi:hypothetical protein
MCKFQVWLESRRHRIKVSLVDKASAIMASQTTDRFGRAKGVFTRRTRSITFTLQSCVALKRLLSDFVTCHCGIRQSSAFNVRRQPEINGGLAKGPTGLSGLGDHRE